MRYLSLPVMLVNIAIAFAVVLAIYITKNPLCIFGLLYMQDMPHYQLNQVLDPEDDKEPSDYNGSDSMGFTGNKKK